MADVVTRLVVESKEYDSKIARATQGLTQFEKKCREVGGTLEFVEKEDLDFVKALGQMETVSSSATGKMSELKKAFTELSVQYKNLTDAEKKSPYGQALAESLEKLKSRYAELKGTLDSVNSSIEGSNTTVMSAKQQMREYTDMIMTLTQTYRSMSDEQRNSDAGMEIAAQIEETKQKAAELKDMMSDVNAEISGMSSDTSALESITGSLSAMASGFQVAQGAMSLFGVKEKEAMQIMVKLQAAMAVTNGLTRIQSALQKQSAVMIGISTVQKKAAAAAEKLDTAAKGTNIVVTKAATVAQAALNAVAYANPYILLAMAIVGVCAALGGLISSSDDATEAEERSNEAAEKTKEKFRKIGEQIGNTMGLYQKLRREWVNLSSEQEKETWLEINSNAFKQLGLAINDAVDADNAFVTNSDKVIDALMARAKASAIADLYQDEFSEQIKEASEAAKELAVEFSANFAKLSIISQNGGKSGVQKFADQYNLKAGEDYTLSQMPMMDENGRPIQGSKLQALTDTGFQKVYGKLLNAKIGDITDKIRKQWEPVLDIVEKEAEEASDKAGDIMADKYNPEMPKDEYQEGSIGYLEQEISKIKDKYRHALTQETRDSLSKEIAEMEDELSTMTAKPKVEFADGSIAKAKEDLKGFQKEWEETADPTERDKLKKQIDELNEKIKEMSGNVKKADTAWDMWTKQVEKIEDIKARLTEFKSMISDISLSIEQRNWAEGMAKDYQEQLDKMTNATEHAVDDIKSKFDSINSGISAISTIGNAFDNIKGSVEDLQEAFSGEMDAWDALMTVFNSGISIMQTVMGVMEAINTLQQLSGTLSDQKKEKQLEETTTVVAGKMAEQQANLQEAGTSMTAAGANAAESSSAAGKSVAGIPIVGPILAVAAIAAVLAATFAAMSKAKSAGKFATGGLIPGNSFSGDNQIASVNAGELILNRSQQDSIASQLQGGATQTVVVEGRISGKDILLSANNTNRAAGGSRGYYTKVK